MNTRKILPLMAALLVLAAPCGFADPISLSPGSHASATFTPVAVDDPDNPLHLSASQQLHINARKLRFQKDATAVLDNAKISDVNKGIKVKALEKEASSDILGMLAGSQRAKVESAEKASASQNKQAIEAAKARQALAIRYIAARERLMKSISPTQAKTLLNLEKTSQAKIQSVVNDKMLSKDAKQKNIRTIFAAYEQKRDAIYSPAQRAIMAEMVSISNQAQNLK